MNRVQISGLLLAIIFVGLSIYSGALADPYYDRDYKVSVGESADFQHAEYQYTELSPASQRLFDQNTGIKERTADVEADKRYEADVCREFTIVCDGYLPQNLPEEFEYDNTINRESIIVQKDGTEYYFSVRQSDYFPAADDFGPDGEETAVGFLRAFTLLLGVFIGTVMIDAGYELGLESRRKRIKTIIGVFAVLTTLLSVWLLVNADPPPTNEAVQGMFELIISILLFAGVIATILIIASLIPVSLAMKVEKDSKSVQKTIIGGIAIAGFIVVSPYLTMYDVIDIGVARQTCLLLFVIYILGVFSDYIKTVMFE
jgi:hypothetical protein